jgi:hypothetical protein
MNRSAAVSRNRLQPWTLSDVQPLLWPDTLVRMSAANRQPCPCGDSHPIYRANVSERCSCTECPLEDNVEYAEVCRPSEDEIYLRCPHGHTAKRQRPPKVGFGPQKPCRSPDKVPEEK